MFPLLNQHKKVSTVTQPFKTEFNPGKIFAGDLCQGHLATGLRICSPCSGYFALLRAGSQIDVCNKSNNNLS